MTETSPIGSAEVAYASPNAGWSYRERTTQVLWVVRLRLALVWSGIRSGGMDGIGLVLGLLMGTGFGFLVGAAIALGGPNTASGRAQMVVVSGIIPLIAATFGLVVGTEGSIDPRKLAILPVDGFTLGLGSLLSGIVGVTGPGMMFVGIGTVLGFAPRGPQALITIAAVITLGLLLLVTARTVSNVMGLAILGRWQRAAQLLLSLLGLVVAVGAQGISWALRQPAEWWESTAASLDWLPSTRLGKAIVNSHEVGASLANLGIGVVALGGLVVLHGWSFGRLMRMPAGATYSATKTPTGGGIRQAAVRSLAFLVPPRLRRWWETPSAAIAWRSLRLNLRHPRQLATLLSALVMGLGPALFVALLGPRPVPPLTVFVGAALQFVVLFNGLNCFGVDGRALGLDLLAATPDQLVRGKRVATGLVAAPLVPLVPVVLAALSGGWRYVLPAMVLGTAALIVSSAVAVLVGLVVPVPLPDSPNAFASPENGSGCMASLVFVAALFALSILTLPVAAALAFAQDELWVIAGVAGVTLGLAALLGAGIRRTAVAWLDARVPETFARVAPKD